MTRQIQNEIQKKALCDAAKNAVLPRFPRRVTHALILFEKDYFSVSHNANLPIPRVVNE